MKKRVKFILLKIRKRCIIIYLYHGTTLENALEIFSNRVIKGKKAYQKHKNRYVSFTQDKSVACQFGEVVIRFNAVENAKPVEYKNEEWMKENTEIVEFILNDKVFETLENVASVKLEKVKGEKEHVLKNKYDFTKESVTIYLMSDNDKELEEMKKQLLEVVGAEDKITKNKKFYQDFLATLSTK